MPEDTDSDSPPPELQAAFIRITRDMHKNMEEAAKKAATARDRFATGIDEIMFHFRQKINALIDHTEHPITEQEYARVFNLEHELTGELADTLQKVPVSCLDAMMEVITAQLSHWVAAIKANKGDCQCEKCQFTRAMAANSPVIDNEEET